MASIKDRFKIGPKCIICQDAELRGDITIGQGCVLHPKCTILAVLGPIIIGDECIIEENSIILNTSKEPMLIGHHNHFEVGTHVEARKVGSWNTFEIKSRVPNSVTIGDRCVIGAACHVRPIPPSHLLLLDDNDEKDDHSQTSTRRDMSLDTEPEPGSEMSIDTATKSPPPSVSPNTNITTEDQIPSYTVIYGSDSQRRIWSGQGQRQQEAAFIKHLDYLRDILPKYSKLKMIQNTL